MILLISHSHTWFNEIHRAALCLRRCNIPSRVLLYDYVNHLRDAKKVIDGGIEASIDLRKGSIINIALLNSTSSGTDLKEKSRFKFVRTLLLEKYSSLGIGIVLTLVHLIKNLLVLKRIERLLLCIKPSIVILGGDNIGYDTASYIKIAHKHNINVLVIPATISNGKEEAEIFSKMKAYRVETLFSRIVAKLYPHWLREHDGIKVLRLPPEKLLAKELLGISNKTPWIYHNGEADQTIVDSNAMLEYYVNAGINPKKLTNIGTLINDTLAEKLSNKNQLRNELYRELNINNDKPMLLCSIPSNFLYLEGGRPECDFKKYEDLEDFWLTSLCLASNYNVIINLHPSVDFQSTKERYSKYNVYVTSRLSYEVIPICDIFVASVSCVIRWAIACGKPVVNYDVYRYRYDDYKTAPGVIHIEEQDEFVNTIKLITKDDKFRTQIEKRQLLVANDWGLLDGKVHERFMKVVNDLSRSPEVP